MSGIRVFITSMGIVSPIGQGTDDTLDALVKSKNGIAPLRLFPTAHTPPLPVGEIARVPDATAAPRTHAIALLALEEVMKDAATAPDAVVLGVTTGGMSRTEELLKAGDKDAVKYSNHGPATVSECLARKTGCTGPVLTVSTACSSGAVALSIALGLLRSGAAKSILAGGADSLCRLTYHGFNALQLVDPSGARPFDRNRRGMSGGGGAAFFLLPGAKEPPLGAVAELLGRGLSCDAYHPATPHPGGAGALGAMVAALADAGVAAEEIDYIHLHGTGTIDNDLAESKAVRTLYADRPVPPVSSSKGAVGHSLAAAGAIGAAFSAIGISRGILPANTRFRDADPSLGLEPVAAPIRKKTDLALVNAFGFGGNNAAVVLGHPGRMPHAAPLPGAAQPASFSVLGSAFLTGAGDAEASLDRLDRGMPLRGIVPPSEVGRSFPEKAMRRLKRLPRLALSLAAAACNTPEGTPPSSVFMGTGWGALTETHDFINKLFETGEQFTSPTDFIGSVHNAAAGHVAIHFGARGPNVTTTGGDCAFEQALLTAGLLARTAEAILVLGADEHHPVLSPLFDASVACSETPSDGGGALLLRPEATGQIRCPFLAYADGRPGIVPELVARLGAHRIAEAFGAVMVGIPAAAGKEGGAQLREFLSLTHFPHPIVDYRPLIGEFASASAVAAVLAVRFVQAGEIVREGRRESLEGRGMLVLGLGRYVTAVEVMPR